MRRLSAMRRMKINYVDQGVMNYIYKQAHKNSWRVAKWYDLDDLIQDGVMVAYKCQDAFTPTGATRDDQRLFMGYFKTAFQNHITDLANYRTATPEVSAASLQTPGKPYTDDWMTKLVDSETASLSVWVSNAPSEIKDLLKAILVDGALSARYLRTQIIKKTLPSGSIRLMLSPHWLRETNVDYYARILGRGDADAVLQEYFAA